MLFSFGGIKAQTKKTTQQRKSEFPDVFYDAGIQKLFGNNEKALELYEKAAEIEPSSAAAHYFAALLYYEKSEYESCILHVKKSIETEDQHLWYNFLLASAYERLSEFKKSEKIYKKLIAKYPQKDFLYKDLIDLYLDFQKFTDAVKLYKDYVKYNVPDEDYGLLIYRNLQNKPTEARNFASYMRGIFRDTLRYDMLIAETYILSEEVEKAEKIYMNYYKSKNMHADLLVTLYNYFYYTDYKDISNEIENRIIDSDTDLETKMKVAIVQRKDNKERYIKTLEKLSLQYPDNPLIAANSADVMFDKNDFENAYINYKNAFVKSKDDFMLNLNLLKAADQKEQYADMAAFADTILMYMPNQPIFYCHAAYAALKNRKIKKAEDFLLTGEQLIINNSVEIQSCFTRSRAALAFMQKDYENAKKHYETLSNFEEFKNISDAMLLITKELSNKGGASYVNEIKNLKSQLPIQFYNRIYALALVKSGQKDKAYEYLNSEASSPSPYTLICKDLLKNNSDILFLP